MCSQPVGLGANRVTWAPAGSVARRVPSRPVRRGRQVGGKERVDQLHAQHGLSLPIGAGGAGQGRSRPRGQRNRPRDWRELPVLGEPRARPGRAARTAAAGPRRRPATPCSFRGASGVARGRPAGRPARWAAAQGGQPARSGSSASSPGRDHVRGPSRRRHGDRPVAAKNAVAPSMSTSSAGGPRPGGQRGPADAEVGEHRPARVEQHVVRGDRVVGEPGLVQRGERAGEAEGDPARRWRRAAARSRPRPRPARGRAPGCSRPTAGPACLGVGVDDRARRAAPCTTLAAQRADRQAAAHVRVGDQALVEYLERCPAGSPRRSCRRWPPLAEVDPARLARAEPGGDAGTRRPRAGRSPPSGGRRARSTAGSDTHIQAGPENSFATTFTRVNWPAGNSRISRLDYQRRTPDLDIATARSAPGSADKAERSAALSTSRLISTITGPPKPAALALDEPHADRHPQPDPVDAGRALSALRSAASDLISTRAARTVGRCRPAGPR